jgi:Predicted exonuclease of the beta-lactamase fold involved in RNA processing
MRVEFNANGIHLPEIGLWLDPKETRDAAWLSHGHAGHASAPHCTIFGTQETLNLYRIRRSEQENLPHDLRPVEFGQPFEFGKARLTAYPAGHILGAAQLLVEYGGERLLYTGDIKLREPLCGLVTEVVPCDHLIVESTFGLPIYHFLSAAEARDRIIDFAQTCIAEEIMPVFLAYPLGPAQEVVHALCAEGIPTAVHGSITRFFPEYERSGYAFPGWMPYESSAAKGRAIVVASGTRNYLEASGKQARVAYVSGWACLDNARTRAGAEELIPYSDHADFEELMELVERSEAREIDVIHGYTEPFARILQLRGRVARAPSAAAYRDEAEG